MKDKQGNILVVDDEQSTIDILFSFLKKNYRVFTARDRDECYSVLSAEHIDLIFLDIMLGRDDGFEILNALKKKIPEVEVIMMSVLKKPDTIVKAMQMGASDFLEKDFQPDDVMFKISRTMKAKRSKMHQKYFEIENTRQWDGSIFPPQELKLSSEMGKLKEHLAECSFVLLEGETGVGKKTLSKAITMENDTQMPFVSFSPRERNSIDLYGALSLNRSEVSPYEYSLADLSDGGILYIQDIDKLSEAEQKKIFLMIERGYYIKNGRVMYLRPKVIASIRKPCARAGDSCGMIPELLGLAEKSSVKVPALRNNKSDILKLARHFIEYYGTVYGKNTIIISQEAEGFFKSYPWFCNIRELKNVIENIVINDLTGKILLEDIPQRHLASARRGTDNLELSPVNLRKGVREFEKDMILKTLRHFGWNRKKTARYLSVPYNTLKVKIRNFRIIKPL